MSRLDERALAALDGCARRLRGLAASATEAAAAFERLHVLAERLIEHGARQDVRDAIRTLVRDFEASSRYLDQGVDVLDAHLAGASEGLRIAIVGAAELLAAIDDRAEPGAPTSN